MTDAFHRLEDLADQVDAFLADDARTQQSSESIGAIEQPTPARRELTPAVVGKYRIVREIGSGGMGRVFEAVQGQTDQRVAIKVLHELAHSSQNLVRFRREARTVASVNRPDVCRLYDVLEADGLPYLVMEFVEGELLSDRLERWRAEDLRADRGSSAENSRIEVVVELVEACAQAAGALHREGLVHRDLKPSNVMLREGRPVLLDFGLAIDTGSDADRVTMSGARVGTPVYMSPEQIEGQRAVDARVDVYALGVVLYEALTLELPFQAATREQLYRRILDGQPTDPRRLRPAVSRDLSAVCLTALHADPKRRYASGIELAADLRAIAERRPTMVRPPSAVERAVYGARRHRWVSLVAAVLLISVAAVVWLRSSRSTAVDEVVRAAAAWERVLDSLAEEGEVDPSALDVVASYWPGVAPEDLARRLSGGGAAAASFGEYLRRVRRRHRGETGAIAGLWPQAAVRSLAPEFRFECDRDGLMFRWELSGPAGTELASGALPAPDANGVVSWQLPDPLPQPDPMGAPAARTFVWTVHAMRDSIELERATAEFEWLPPSAPNPIEPTGPEPIRLLGQAFELLERRLAGAALATLARLPADAGPELARARDGMLRWARVLAGQAVGAPIDWTAEPR